MALPRLDYRPGTYLQPLAGILSKYEGPVVANGIPYPVAFQPSLPNGYAQNLLFGMQQSLPSGWSIEVDGIGSLGRRLLTTDIVNRAFSLPKSAGGLPYNPALGDIAYRGSQGFSDYYALAAVARRRFRRGYLQAAYTLSHAIDNQSDPLTGDYADLSFVKPAASQGVAKQAAFSHQFDSRGDRGSADFDQRHNLIVFSRWDLPEATTGRIWRAVLRDWRVSQIAAFRSGFPFTVIGVSPVPEQGGGSAINLRAGVRGSAYALEPAQPTPGGELILNRAAFCSAADCPSAVLGRNAFRGPGLFSVDFSLARSLRVPALGDSGRISIRADAFNVLNHANLNPPNAALGSADFGVATYGRVGRDTGFPASRPLNETARQIQLLFRLEF